MVKVYIASIENISINKLKLNKLPKYRREKIARIRSEEAKLQSYAAGLLIDNYISNKEIKINEFGKPYADGVFFNLAHSGNLVILAVSDKAQVGCDVERLRDENFLRLGRVVYTDNEIEALKSSDDMKRRFFEFWTKKEAYIKAIGEGFHFPVKSLDLTVSPDFVEKNGVKYHFVDYMLGDYGIMICSPNIDVEFIHVNNALFV